MEGHIWEVARFLIGALVGWTMANVTRENRNFRRLQRNLDRIGKRRMR